LDQGGISPRRYYQMSSMAPPGQQRSGEGRALAPLKVTADCLKTDRQGRPQQHEAVAKVKANADERASNLRAILADLRAEGVTSVRRIADELNRRGVLTPRGATWHATSAARLLERVAAATD
jgi:hypothetical protein